MRDQPLLRLLDVVRQRLDARDARIEIGGEPPAGEGIVWAPLDGPWRIVALLREGAAPDEARQRLVSIADAFRGVPKKQPPPVLRGGAARVLNSELSTLAERAGALYAMVIDGTTPILWGSSHEDMADDGRLGAMMHAIEPIEKAVAKLGSFAAVLETPAANLPGAVRLLASGREEEAWVRFAVASRALDTLRDRCHAPSSHTGSRELVRRIAVAQDDFGLDARLVADIYYAVLCYDGRFSEIRADRELKRATPIIERLVAALPPVDPPPKGGRVLPFRDPSR